MFGDILFEEHRQWAERSARALGLTAVEPLWGLSTTTLFASGASGSDAVIVTARAEFLDEAGSAARFGARCSTNLPGSASIPAANGASTIQS